MADSVLPIGDLVTITTSDEQSHKLPFLETLLGLREVLRKHADGEQRVWLKAAQVWLQEEFGLGLTLGEVDNLSDRLELEYARKKKGVYDAMASTRVLRGTTDSTPSA